MITCGDMSGLPDMQCAPFSEADVAKVEAYQTGHVFHPYTCCDHQTMQMTCDGLKCPKCGVVQDWILVTTLRLMEEK